MYFDRYYKTFQGNEKAARGIYLGYGNQSEKVESWRNERVVVEDRVRVGS